MNTIEVNPFAVWGPRDYVKLPDIPDHWNVVDVGPGPYPLKRANMYIDRSREILDAIDLQPGQQTRVGSLNDGLPAFADKAFDFAFCSHVLEHCIELQACIDTLNRIAKRGTIVVPSFAKEAMLHFQEREHLWLCHENPTHGGPLIFVEGNHGFMERLRDPLAQQATSFLYQTGSQHDCTAEQFLRAWWQLREPDLDLVAHWDEKHPLKVIAIR